MNFFKLQFLISSALFILAFIGQSLGTTYGLLNISLIWPVSGVALACILLFGNRAFVGIFLGLFFYYLFLFENHDPIASACFSLGAALQALVGGIVMKRLSSGAFLSSVRDVVVFLIPTGLLATLISSSIAITTLYYYGNLSEELLIRSWLNFYIGDVFGIYVFTPLILVWFIQKQPSHLHVGLGETLLMILSFLLLTFLMIYAQWPLGQFYIPLSVWATYRYHMRGASLINLFIALTAVIPALFGIGSWVFYVTENQLPILVAYLGTVMSTSLLLAAVLNERSQAWNALKSHNINLSEAVHSHKSSLKNLSHEIIVKNKLATFGMLALVIAKQMFYPIKSIFTLTEKCQRLFDELSEKIPSDAKVNEMKHSLEAIRSFEQQTLGVVKAVDELSLRGAYFSNEVKSINLHTLLNQCLEESLQTIDMPKIQLKKEFHHATSMVVGLAEDLENAFRQIFKRSVDSMRRKYKKKQLGYTPLLSVRTQNRQNAVEVTIEDNGLGISENELTYLIKSFFGSEIPSDMNQTELALAHDILAQVHQGKLEAASKEGEYLQFKITLPLLNGNATGS